MCKECNESVKDLTLRSVTSHFPESVEDAAHLYEQVTTLAKLADDYSKKLKAYIVGSIPVNQTDDKGHAFGILHGVKVLEYEQRATAWKKVCDQIVMELVPKTKHARANEIVKNTSTASKRVKISREEV